LFNATLVPAAVRCCLDLAGLNHRPILLSIDTDISLDGQGASEWLVVTKDHLSVIRQGGEPLLLRLFAWDQVEKCRTNSGTGSGLLQVQVRDEGWVDLLRYSNGHAGRFHKISRCLEQLREGGRDPLVLSSDALHDVDALDPPRCPSCQLRLAHSHEVCPRCLQKGQILRRVTELLRPHLRGAIGLTALTIVGVAAELIPPMLQQYLVDNILATDAVADPSFKFTTALLVVVLALVASRVVLSAVGVLKGRLATIIGTGLTSTLRSQMVQKLQQLAVVYYGRPETTIEAGLQAARAAGAHDFICRTQLGYETLLGEQGAGLSGGEKQRLSIARTLMYDPHVLILDEATSNIDAESERSIQEALEVLTQGRTTIAIAHRLSTLRNADRIIVFDRGQLVEQGSHAELLARDGTYAKLVRIRRF